jgi:putative peptidoglycan lipid II flippase
LLYPYFSRPVIGLSVGVMLGGAAQFLVQLPYLLKEGFKPRPDTGFSHPAVREVMVLMVPAAFGASVYQINILITQILCMFSSEGKHVLAVVCRQVF